MSMMSAERWYEYQDHYKRYGFDMKPEKIKSAPKASKSAVSLKDKVAMLFLIALAGMLCVALVIATAYAAGVKYETNAAIKRNAELLGEIENLTVKIKQATNIETVEQKAIHELGMFCPDPDQVVYVICEENPAGDFAALLKEQAYN